MCVSFLVPAGGASKQSWKISHTLNTKSRHRNSIDEQPLVDLDWTKYSEADDVQLGWDLKTIKAIVHHFHTRSNHSVTSMCAVWKHKQLLCSFIYSFHSVCHQLYFGGLSNPPSHSSHYLFVVAVTCLFII